MNVSYKEVQWNLVDTFSWEPENKTWYAKKVNKRKENMHTSSATHF